MLEGEGTFSMVSKWEDPNSRGGSFAHAVLGIGKLGLVNVRTFSNR